MEPLRLAIVGCGQVVERYHLPALAGLGTLGPVAAVDIDPTRRAWIAARLPGITVAEDLDTILDPRRVDAALIATAPPTHAELAARCLTAGLAVLVEKPLATSTDAAAATVRAAMATGRRLAVGFNRRFRLPWRRARTLLGAGDRIDAAHLTFVSDGGRWGTRLTDADAALKALLDDIVPHQVDLVAWLFDRFPVEVQAGEVAFTAGHELILDYELQIAGGLAIACRAGYGTTHGELFRAEAGGRTLLVHPAGAGWLGAGAGVARALAAPSARFADAWCKITGRPNATQVSFTAELAAFAEAVRGRPTPDLANGADGLFACRAVEALRSSLNYDGAPVGIRSEGRETNDDN